MKHSSIRFRQTKCNYFYFIISESEFLTGKDVLPEKDLLKKAETMKRFEYSSLRKVSKAQTDIEKKQYQKLNKMIINLVKNQ